MNINVKYWQICHLSLSNESRYEYQTIERAKTFLQENELADIKEKKHQLNALENLLLSQFKSSDELNRQALSGLCLRCKVSHSILWSCQNLARLFGFNRLGQFTYRDLLPFVLDDDGKNLIVLDEQKNNQLHLDMKAKLHTTEYKIFSVEVLRLYQPSQKSTMKLDSWVYLKTKQHPALKEFLGEHGFQQLSDWALLNRIGKTQLERLTQRDRHLLEAFHAVYRRDRRELSWNRGKKCPEPTFEQLDEMAELLKAWGINDVKVDSSYKMSEITISVNLL